MGSRLTCNSLPPQSIPFSFNHSPRQTTGSPDRPFANNHSTTAQPAADLRTAYQQAQNRYRADPTNPNVVRVLGWVYADLLKDASGSADTARMLRGMATVATFPMNPTDRRWRESVGWSVCRFLLRHKPETLLPGPLWEVIVAATPFVPTEPGLLRSVWWRALLRHQATGIDWLGLFDTLGWDGGFRPDDEAAEVYAVVGGESKTARPLVEGLIQAVAKQLLETIPMLSETTEPWLARIADLSSRHPDWDFLPYFHAKLLIRLDRTAEAMAVFMPFARNKKREFWVWSLLTELVAPQQIGACYARALTLGTPEPFLVKVRQHAAAWLITQNRWTEARAELDRLVQTRQANQWPIPPQVQQWTNAPAYTQAERVPLGEWYGPLLPEADALLWADTPETVALVTGVDPTGRYVNVAIDAQTTGSFPAGKFGLTSQPGDRLAVRYRLQEKKGRQQLQVLTATVCTAELTHLTIRTLAGPLRAVSGRNMAFVGNVYVPGDLLQQAGLPADTLAWVAAIPSWDAVKQQTGWRAFLLQKESLDLLA